MTKDEIYGLIKSWEEDVGESFVDYFNSDINARTYMTWCLGRKYISPNQFNAWLVAYSENKLEADDPNYFVYNEDNDEDVPFAVVISEEWNEEDQRKAYQILAEFISEIDDYIGRLKEFLSEYDLEVTP
ncbi:MAG: hypothetical protein ACQEV7_16390 [Bacillota bacterium]